MSDLKKAVDKAVDAIKPWSWPFLRVNSGGDKEYACRHGVGHGGTHGCDGCCSDPDFPKAEPKYRRGTLFRSNVVLTSWSDKLKGNNSE